MYVMYVMSEYEEYARSVPRESLASVCARHESLYRDMLWRTTLQHNLFLHGIGSKQLFLRGFVDTCVGKCGDYIDINNSEAPTHNCASGNEGIIALIEVKCVGVCVCVGGYFLSNNRTCIIAVIAAYICGDTGTAKVKIEENSLV